MALSTSSNFELFTADNLDIPNTCKKRGILYEVDHIQIGFRVRVKRNYAKVSIYYFNKDLNDFEEFTPTLLWSDELASKLRLELRNMFPLIIDDAQLEQRCNALCVEEYRGTPRLKARFLHHDLPESIIVELPLTLNRFMVPYNVPKEEFFQLWEAFESSESTKYASSSEVPPEDIKIVRAKLQGFGWQILEDFDPTDQSAVYGAGTLNMTKAKVSCLLQAQFASLPRQVHFGGEVVKKEEEVLREVHEAKESGYRIAVRSEIELVSLELCSLLIEILDYRSPETIETVECLS